MIVTHMDIGGIIVSYNDSMTEQEKKDKIAEAKKLLEIKKKAQQQQQIVKK